jgi:hypothetical protein
LRHRARVQPAIMSRPAHLRLHHETTLKVEGWLREISLWTAGATSCGSTSTGTHALLCDRVADLAKLHERICYMVSWFHLSSSFARPFLFAARSTQLFFCLFLYTFNFFPLRASDIALRVPSHRNTVK